MRYEKQRGARLVAEQEAAGHRHAVHRVVEEVRDQRQVASHLRTEQSVGHTVRMRANIHSAPQNSWFSAQFSIYELHYQLPRLFSEKLPALIY